MGQHLGSINIDYYRARTIYLRFENHRVNLSGLGIRHILIASAAGAIVGIVIL